MTLNHLLISCLLLLAVAACGGGGDTDGYQDMAERADAKEAQARTLAPDSPCTSAAQCGNLTFMQPRGCGDLSFKPYSLVATSAPAASATAAEQRELAQRAQQLAPPSNIACIAMVRQPPALACRASACQVQ